MPDDAHTWPTFRNHMKTRSPDEQPLEPKNRLTDELRYPFNNPHIWPYV